MARKLLTIALLALFTINDAFAQCNWELKTEKDGIKIYTSLVPDSKIKAVKVEANFDATTAQMVSLIMDVKNSTEWVYHVKSAMLLKQVSPTELYYYSEVSLPWPATNRDFVAHLKVTENPVTKAVTIDGPAVEGFVPEKKGIVRVNNSTGRWVITPIGDNEIRVQYTIHVDPGGTLPAWLVNMFATEGPLKIFSNIKTQLAKPEYKNFAMVMLR